MARCIFIETIDEQSYTSLICSFGYSVFLTMAGRER
jgi:hypothetical protein